MPPPTCKVCDTGTLEPRKRYRMGPVVVAIGWILLVPSLLAMLVSAGGFVISIVGGTAGGAAAQENLDKTRLERMTEQFGARFEEANIPREHIETVVNDPETVDAQATANLDPKARSVLELLKTQVEIDRRAGEVGAAAAGGLGAIFFAMAGVGSLVGGLLGWLLVQKKKVLQCVSCGATIAAS